ncbi:MAG: methyltransferase domain-containing protein [Gammaproteobacteria bacterium]|nr:methyltransferase domain-containing protein [Gammaproteobacteria bacterium]
MSQIYWLEIDRRFVPVIEQVIASAGLKPGERALDLGAGTGSVALRAATLVAPGGHVTGLDISSEMLALARRRAVELDLDNISFREGRAEAIPAEDAAFDVVLASLSLMYVIDRAAAPREIARVIKPGGRMVVAVWAGAEKCDIVRFQQIASSFAPTPPVPNVSPWALADPAPFLVQLAEAGIDARVETETLGFSFDDFALAWKTLAGVTVGQLPPERQQEAGAAVMAEMWPNGDGPRYFRNEAHFITGQRPIK